MILSDHLKNEHNLLLLHLKSDLLNQLILHVLGRQQQTNNEGINQECEVDNILNILLV